MSENKEIRLTAKQSKFVENKIKGMNNTDAYIDAYPTSRKWERYVATNKGYELMQHPGVRAKIEEYERAREDELRRKYNRTFAASIRDLEAVIMSAKISLDEEGITGSNARALIDSVKVINDMFGYSRETEIKEARLQNDIDKGDERIIIVNDVSNMEENLEDFRKFKEEQALELQELDEEEIEGE